MIFDHRILLNETGEKYIFTHDWFNEFHIRWVICSNLCVLIWDDVMDDERLGQAKNDDWNTL